MLMWIFIVQWLRPLPRWTPAPATSIYLRSLWHLKLSLDSLPNHRQFPLLGTAFPQCLHLHKLLILQNLAPGSLPPESFPTALGWLGYPTLSLLAPYTHYYTIVLQLLLCYCELWLTCLPSYLTTISWKEDTRHCSACTFQAHWTFTSAQ